MKPRSEQRPKPKPTRFLEDRVAYVICAEQNRGDCQCQWREQRPCQAMEMVACNVLAMIEAHPDAPRRPGASGGGFL